VTPRPKILQILYSGLGGHSAVSTTLVEAGGDTDPWAHHFLFFGIEPVAPAYVDDCQRQGVPFDYVAARQGRPWEAWPALARTVKAIAPDAIILHSIKAILPVRLAAGPRPLVAVEHQANALKTRAEWIASGLAQHLADRVVTLSPDYRATLRSRLGPLFSDRRTRLVRTGIHLPPAGSAPASILSSSTCRIGMASRFTPTKAQEDLVAAMARLRDTHPGLDFRLALAGDGPRLPAVREAVRKAGLEDRVELPGHLPPDQLPDWFASLDIYAQASDGETLSTALLQAMAAGIPVAGSDVPGISDLLGSQAPGEAPLGRLVPARNADALATAFAELAGDPAAARDQADRARVHVTRHHSPQAMRAGYAEVLEELWPAK